MAVDISRYMPGIVTSIGEVKAAADAISAEFEYSRPLMLGYLNNQFIASMDEDTVALYESFLKITPDTDDTLEERKSRLLVYFKGDTPYTIYYLREHLSELVDEDNLSIDMDFSSGVLTVYIAKDKENLYSEIRKLLERILPCNIRLVLGFMGETTHGYLKTMGYTHADLAGLTHEYIREKLIEDAG